MQKVRVPNLNPIRPAFRNFPKKLIQRLREIASPRNVAGIKSRKLEHQQPHIRADGLARPQEPGAEQIRIQKVFIDLARPLSKSRQVWKTFQRDLVRNLEG